MSLIDRAKRSLQRTQDNYPCADCGKLTAPGEVHTYLFCALYRVGWSRGQIIANTLYTADVLRDADPDLPAEEE